MFNLKVTAQGLTKCLELAAQQKILINIEKMVYNPYCDFADVAPVFWGWNRSKICLWPVCKRRNWVWLTALKVQFLECQI